MPDDPAPPQNIASLPRALYVHVPFCLHHCGYCDFTLVANRDHLIPEYLTLLAKEFEWLCRDFSEPQPIQTLYIGGGTPTHLSPHHLQLLFDVVCQYFRLNPGGEYSIEANPDGLCNDRLEVLRDNGINRLSLGVQSFDDDVLKTLERTHSSVDAKTTIQRASEFIPNVSVDLIFGVPGQTAVSWSKTVSELTQLPVKHTSTYGLTYEQGTAFFRRERAGALRRLPDELEREMYLDGIRILEGHGFEHYEVSSFAKCGFQCRHNNVYWDADEYYAFGPGAARYVNGVRSTNCRSVVKWINSWRNGQQCLEESEELPNEEKAREAIMLALRRMKGLHVPSFEARFSVNLTSLAGEEMQQHMENGLLELNGDQLRLTREGLLIADSVVADFL